MHRTNHMVYDAADQLTSWPGMHTYTYYNDGSLREVKNPVVMSGFTAS